MSGKKAKAKKKDIRNTPPAEKKKLAARKQLNSFARRFVSAAVLTVVPVSLIPESWYAPLNHLTAWLAGYLIQLSTQMSPQVHGTQINLDGFSVNVISECSAVHLIVLYAAFIYTYPAPRVRKWIGLIVGAAMLFVINVIRIAAVTLTGRYFPHMFEVVHIYFGQLGMLSAVVFICLIWCRWVTDPVFMESPTGFFMRFVLISALFFVPWLLLNRVYIYAIDSFVERLFSLADYRLLIPRTHRLYYQTFSLVALTGLLLASRGVRLSSRLRWMAFGIAAVTTVQVAYRICNVWISAFKFEWAAPVSQIVYVTCVHALPFGIAVLFLMKVRTERAIDEERLRQ